MGGHNPPQLHRGKGRCKTRCEFEYNLRLIRLQDQFDSQKQLMESLAGLELNKLVLDTELKEWW